MPRHGMDLLTIDFGDTPDDDTVNFWEIKSTFKHFNDRCKEIIVWFNQNSESYLTMVIEAAKMDWKDKFTEEQFKRASSVLAKFLYYRTNFVFLGSIIYDSNYAPNDKSIRQFECINVKKENKEFTIFNMDDMKDILDEVYGPLCKI